MALGIATAVFAGLSALSSVAQSMKSREAVKEQRKSQNLELAVQVNNNQREAMKAREIAYQRAAAVRQMAQNTGGGEGSAALGTVGSISTRLGESIGNQSIQSWAARGMSRFNQRAADNQSVADAWGVTSDIFGKAAGYTMTGYLNSPGEPPKGTA